MTSLNNIYESTKEILEDKFNMTISNLREYFDTSDIYISMLGFLENLDRRDY